MHIVAHTEQYDHCNFTILREKKHPDTDKFVQLLLAMDYEDHEVRALLDMEGLEKMGPSPHNALRTTRLGGEALRYDR